jgi:hypothetical protein
MTIFRIRSSLIRASGVAALLAVGAHTGAAQDSLLTRLLLANRHTIGIVDGKLDGAGGRLLVDEGRKARFFLVGEEHGIAQTPQVVQALLAELRPTGYNTLAIEVSPLQGQRLDLMASSPRRAIDGNRKPGEEYYIFVAHGDYQARLSPAGILP